MQFDLNALYIILQVIFLEGILSIDNAAVLGAMVSVLPKEEKIPWPAPLKFLGPPVHRILGGQRPAALKVGLLGAYFGRGLMLVLASFVIHNPYLKILGAIYLIKVAFENLGAPEANEDEYFKGKGMRGRGFWGVVVAVELADLAFSLDNVVAVVALSDNLYIVMFGVAMGIITMRFAATIFTAMIFKEPILKPAAYLVVFNIGTELLLDEFAGIKFGSATKFMISGGTLVLAVIYARVRVLHFLNPVFAKLGQAMGFVNQLIEWILIPIAFIIKLPFRAIAFMVRHLLPLFREKGSVAATKEAASQGSD
jgi:tellurite resistance protein TerC